MIMTMLFVLTILGTQVVPAPSPAPTYQAPPVRPFEPSGPMITTPAQTSQTPLPAHRSLETPVTVDAYHGQYEAGTTDTALAYGQGIAQAEMSMDSRMGPLDGLWAVTDLQDRPLFTLVLSDEGPGVAVEGAWRDDRGQIGVVASVLRDDARVDLVLDGRALLHLTRTDRGFDGLIARDGVETPVRLIRD